MRSLCLALMAASCSLPVRAAEPATKHNGRLLVLGIAIDQYPDKNNKETFASYNYCAEDFVKVMRQGGGSVYRQVETRMVLGRAVTHSRCLTELKRLASAVTRQDVAALGIYAHGFTNAKEGWGIETAEKQTLWGHEIKGILGRLPCPVLVVVETCTSGGFARPHRQDIPLPANITALCACRSQQHTNNHLSISVIEGLWGKADFNKNGCVEVGELVRYARRRHQELAPNSRGGKDSELPLLVEAKAGSPQLPLTKVAEDLAAVAVGGEWYQARVIKKNDNGKFHIHLLGWADKPGPYFLTNEVDREHICLPADPPPIKVEVNGKMRLARLLSKDGDRWKVRYMGKKKEDLVDKSKVRQLFGAEAVRQKKDSRGAASVNSKE